jgi:hypothetical protein
MLNKTILGPVTQAGVERKILSVETPQTQTVEAEKLSSPGEGGQAIPCPNLWRWVREIAA